MDADYTAIPRQAWFDLCALAVKYATEEKAARKKREQTGPMAQQTDRSTERN